jgi:serine protease AprX
MLLASILRRSFGESRTTMITAILFGVWAAQVPFSASGGNLLFRGDPVYRASAPIEGLRQFALDSGGSVAVWRDSGRSRYAVSINGDSVAAIAESKQTIDLRYARFDPRREVPPVPPSLESSADNRAFIVQFETQPLPTYHDAIEGLGGRVEGYLPNQAYLVLMSPSILDQVEALPYVRWVGAYRPAYRIAPAILESLSAGSLPKQRYSMLVFESGPAMKAAVAKKVRSLGGIVNDAGPGGKVLEATLTAQQLLIIARMNEVMWVDLWREQETDMDLERVLGGANYVAATPGNFRGQGVRGQMRDTGLRVTHLDFQATPPIVRANNTNDMGHGTSTTGIVFGAGASNPQGTGMLPLGQCVFLAGLSTGATRYSETLPLLAPPYECVFESNSTGSARTLDYDTESANMDQIIFDMDLLICQSQSNAGNQMSRPQAWAKNIVSVGGIVHYNDLNLANDAWNGASIGPALDGRIKPDLSSLYDNVFTVSYLGDNQYTTGFNGTSAATPIVAGHFGLMFQMWAAGTFYQTVAGNSVFSSRPHAMTAKALMINTAKQYSFSGTSANLTRTHQGWGTPQVDTLYDMRSKLFIVNEEDVLAPLTTNSYPLYVAPGESALRATLCYKDPPGIPTSASQDRVNDLTLKVIAPDGTSYYGNNGLLAGNWSTPGGSPNTVDTVECVYVQSPLSGVWTVQVIGSDINTDSHLQTGAIDADYGLVVSGVTTRIQSPTYTLERGSALSGSFSDMDTSNNVRYTVRPGAVFASAEAPARIVVQGSVPQIALSAIRITVESSASTTAVARKIEIYNNATGGYDLLDDRACTTSDTAVTAAPAGTVDYVDSGGAVKVRLSFKTTAAVFSYPWTASVDQLRISFIPQ